jgi:hypothetical protein
VKNDVTSVLRSAYHQLGKTVLEAVKPDRKKKIKTFPIWQPTSRQIDENILNRFVKHQTELKRQIQSSKVLLDQGTII